MRVSPGGARHSPPQAGGVAYRRTLSWFPSRHILRGGVGTTGQGLDEDVLDTVNRTVLARMFWDDPAFMSSTLLRGTLALGMCIINHSTSWNDVRETLGAVERFGRKALSKSAAPA